MTADERRRRWRLITGGEGELAGADRRLDAALGQLYDEQGDVSESGGRRQAGLGSSAPRVARWLGDIRAYFPNTVVQVLQRDAIERLNLHQLLLEPEMLDSVQPDVHLVGMLIALSDALPASSREAARSVVRTLVAEVEARLADRLRAAVRGALHRASRTRRPRHADIDWNRTVRANLRHWQPELRVIIPEQLIGYGRRSPAVQREIILAIDQSGSMAESVVYASIFGSVLASIRSLKTSVVAFDTEVADLSELADDPVELLFGTQLGGGTDINRAVAYCSGLVRDPKRTVLVLISDLFEGGDEGQLLARFAELRAAGVQCVALLALSDSGAPGYDHEVAAALAELGVAAFACTPDAFPDLIAAAIRGADLTGWAERFKAEQAE